MYRGLQFYKDGEFWQVVDIFVNLGYVVAVQLHKPNMVLREFKLEEF